MNPEQARANMVKEWGLEKLSQEEQDSYIERIGKLIYQAVIVRASEEMSSADQAAFDAFMNEHPEAEAPAILDFLSGRIDTFAALIAEETAKLKEMLVPQPVA